MLVGPHILKSLEILYISLYCKHDSVIVKLLCETHIVVGDCIKCVKLIKCSHFNN